MKKRLTLVIAAFAVFAMTAVSFAANTANISVTSEPIRQGATCDKAGGFAITFDDGTTFVGGDQITFDLDFGVTLCRDIDLEIGVNGNIAGPHASNFTTNYLIPVLGSASPLTSTAGDETELTSTNRGVLFKLVGSSGSQRVTLNVMSDIDGDGTLESSNTASLTYDAAIATDVMELSFLDQATYAVAANAANIFAPNATTGIYDGNAATVAQNTLCIDVSNYGENTVDANFDSKADKYTWIPSDPQVAHIVAASGFQFEECKGRNTGYIIMPGTATQNVAATCTAIENELDAQDGTDGFCFAVAADNHSDNKMIIRTSNGAPFDADNYQLVLEILVNGQSGENGVYWTSTAPTTQGYETSADACAADNADGLAIGAATYELATGAAATPVAADTDCTIADAAKAVKLTTAAHGLNLGALDDYLYINLPNMHFDSTFTAGDVLSVKVTILRAPCGELFEGTWEIGTAGCTSAAVSNNARYPYFAKTGAYANALVITNYSGTSGTAAITIYEADGDIFTASATVAANSVFVDLLSNLTMTQTSGSGSFGDARAYVIVNGDFSLDGAAMITNPATGESIGYIPRLY